MSKIVNVEVPDIGDFTDVDIIEVLVNVGDTIAEEDALITLEAEKATIEIPSPSAGTVTEVLVSVNDKVTQGNLILKQEGTEGTAESSNDSDNKTEKPVASKVENTAAAPTAQTTPAGDSDLHAEVVVLGSGPGGYTAAFRAADLGLDVTLVEARETLGGVCLNVGCIPSKALLHVAKVIDDAKDMASHGVTFGEPEIDLDKIRAFKDGVINKLTGGLSGLAKARKVEVVTGYGKFTSGNTVSVEADDGSIKTIAFEKAIIAAGSRVIKLPFIPHDDPRVMDSTGALELEEIPERLLVIGGGIIGLEMAQVYDSLGSKITVVELGDTIIPGADKDISKPLLKKIKKKYENIYLKSKVTNVEAKEEGLLVTFEGKNCPETDLFDRVLVAVGRAANGKLIDAEKAGVAVNDWGFIEVNERQETNVDKI